MKIITQTEFDEIMAKHALWRAGQPGGEKAVFKDVILKDINGAGRDYNFSTFYGSTFYGSTFKSSTFYGSTFDGSTFYGSTFYGSTFKSSTFYGSTFYGSTFKSSTFYGSTFDGSTFYGSTFDGSTFYGSTFYGSTFYGSTFYGSTFKSSTFYGSTFKSSTFDGSTFDGSTFYGSTFYGSTFYGSTFYGSTFKSSTFQTTHFKKTTFDVPEPFQDCSFGSTKRDLFKVLDCTPNEVPALLAALQAGTVNGSAYTGTCACLVGTLANARGCSPTSIPGLTPDSSRPAEVWFLGIQTGDTPANNIICAMTAGWVQEWLDARAKAPAAAVPAPQPATPAAE